MNRSKIQMERLLVLHERLCAGKYPNCAGFAAEMEVSSKTVQRDIDFLRDRMNAPIEYDALRRGFYYTDPNFMLPAISMSEGELTALLIGMKALEQYRGTPVAEEIRHVLEKLSGLMPDPVSVRAEDLYGRFTFSAPPALPVRPEIWRETVRALTARRVLKIRYGSHDHDSEVKPLHLANLHGDWYLFVQFIPYTDLRQLALNRIHSARMTDESFNEDPAQDFRQLLGSAFARFAGDNEPFMVKLRFSAEIANEVELRQWHPQQEAKRLKNGTLELSFPAKGEIEVMRWILAWGRYCKVLAPKFLKDMVTEEIAAMQAV